MVHSSFVDGPNGALGRWLKEKRSLKGYINNELGCHGCNDVRP
jgi:hypothetical protein